MSTERNLTDAKPMDAQVEIQDKASAKNVSNCDTACSSDCSQSCGCESDCAASCGCECADE